MKDKDFLRLLNTLLVVFIITLVILITPIILAKFDNYEISGINNVANSCRDSGLEDAGSCVVKITSGFYKYNVENVGKDLTFSQLKEDGGVCSSWSDYYTEIGKNLGYNAENVIIPISGNTYHEFSVWSNEEAYCILDQTDLNCTELQ